MVAGIGEGVERTDDPPLPMLMDARLAAARARERETAKAMPLLSVRFGVPPVVELPVPPAVPQNPWHGIAESLPADGTTVRAQKPLRHFVPASANPGRSRFRRGVIGFDGDGFTLSGEGVTPVRWLGTVGGLGIVACVLLIITLAWLVSQPWGYQAVSFVGGLIALLLAVSVTALVLEVGITERRRGSHKQTVPWDDLLEAQWERDLRWVSLIYRSYEGTTKPGAVPVIAQLTLGNLTPAHTAALWDVLATYAPDKNRPDAIVSESNPRVTVFGLLVLGSLLGLVSIVVWKGTHP